MSVRGLLGAQSLFMYRLLCIFLCSGFLSAVESAPVALEQTISRFVMREIQGLARNGDVTVIVAPLDPATQVGACANPEVFIPRGSRLWGAVNIGVRCAEPATWTVYVPVEVRVRGRYFAAARKIPAGRVLSKGDVVERTGELTALPDGVLVELDQVIGKRTRVGIAPELPLRATQLEQLPVIRQGQGVTVLLKGVSFSVTSKGKALSNAREGESVRVKSESGRTFYGIARAGGVVEVSY